MSQVSNDVHSPMMQINGLNTYLSNFWKYMSAGILVAKPFIWIVAIYWVCGYIYLNIYFPASISQLFIYFSNLFPLVAFMLPALFLIVALMTAVRRGRHRRIYAIKRLVSPRSMANFLTGVGLLAVLCIFMGMFTSVKISFSSVIGFQHDIWQADLDKFLFFGVDSWHVWFTPIHSLNFQKIVEINYNVFWHLLVFASLVLVVYSDFSKEARIRYMMCFLLSWIVIGTIFAALFLSAGPAYYGLVTGDFLRFGEQLTALAQYENSTAIKYQAYLWGAHLNPIGTVGGGISAFPSMHVALVCLNIFFAFEVNRKLGILATVYALFVWVSSVYLAWHYAIDGLASFILVAIIYYAIKQVKFRISRVAL